MKTMILGLVSALLLAALATSPSYAQTAVSCEQDYTVAAGDWLSTLSEKFLGSPSAYRAIVTQTNLKSETDFTYATVVNPDSIEVGWKLCIPNAETAAALNGANPPAGLDKTALANATYTSMVANGPVTLVNGSYKKQDDPNIPLTTDVSLTGQIAYGDINGVPSAAVITGETGGGSGFFYLLHIMQAQDSKPVEVANTLLGDRSPVIALTVNNNLASVDMITQGPDEPFCCATLRVINNFKLEGSELKLDSQKELGNLGPNGETPGAALTVSGDVIYRERIAMPAGAVVTVRVSDVSLADAPATVIGQEIINDPGNVPVKYSVQYDGSKILPGHRYAVSARIEVNGELMWISTTNIPVITDGAPTENVQILVQRVGGITGGAPTTDANLEKLQAGGWYWKESVYTDGTKATPADPSQYTVNFDSAGSLAAKVDCNQAGGPYTVEGNVITVGQLVSTLALCPPESLGTEFLRDLQALGEFTFDGDNLVVTLKDNLGTITFTPEAATSGMVTEPAAPSLTGVVWEWQGSKYNYGTTPNPTPNNPSNYTVQFGDDGQLAAQADCNQAGGPYTVQDGNLSIGPLRSTLALCPEGSLGSEFLLDLESAAAYSFDGANLVIALREGRGLAYFAPAGSTSPSTPTPTPTPQPQPPAQSLTGVVWKWQFSKTATEETTPDDPNKYTVEFTADGKVQIKADCNRGSATYTTDGTVITISPIALTRAFCGEASKDTLFVSQLQSAANYSLMDSDLWLNLADNAGQMKFSK